MTVNPMTEQDWSTLRQSVAEQLSDYRMEHTLGVERMAARLASLYCPEKESLLRAAALLHDVTKEQSNEEQRAIFAAHGITLRPDEQVSPQVWHGMTAALVIPQRYPTLADPELISAVRWHTTGRAGMTLTEALLFLADYIEEGRRFASCIALRKAFFDAVPERMDAADRRRHLHRILLQYFENMLSKLREQGSTVCLDSLAAWEDLKNRTDF